MAVFEDKYKPDMEVRIFLLKPQFSSLSNPHDHKKRFEALNKVKSALVSTALKMY